MSYIYGLKDPRDGKIRYVGKTDNLKSRLRDHLYLSPNRADAQSTHKNNWIRGLQQDGLNPVMVILEMCDASVWQERERYWIAELRGQGESLTNGTPGGEGGPANLGKKLLERQKEHLRRPKTEACKQKIRESLLGRHLSEEIRKKIGDSLRGQPKPPFSEETRARMSVSRRARPAPSEETKRRCSESMRRRMQEDPTILERLRMQAAAQRKT